LRTQKVHRDVVQLGLGQPFPERPSCRIGTVDAL
jgi:hypothetical protein